MGAGFVTIIWLAISGLLGLALCVLAGLYFIARIKQWKNLSYLAMALATPFVIMLAIIALGGVFFFAVVFDIGAFRWTPPTDSSVQGLYQISEDSRRWLAESKGYSARESTITVGPGDTIFLSSIPDFDGFGKSDQKTITGTGTFKINKELRFYYDLVLSNSDTTSEIVSGMTLRIMRGGDLRITIGDPDSAEYIYFKKKS